MELTSPAFELNEQIPERYTCDGENVNPPLDFFEVPEGTQSLALIFEDLDAPAGSFVHWILWNIDPKFDGIGEGNITEGAIEGITSFGAPGYGGPCPPVGTHRYFFRLYALSVNLDLPASARSDVLFAAMEGNILATAELMGKYSRE